MNIWIKRNIVSQEVASVESFHVKSVKSDASTCARKITNNGAVARKKFKINDSIYLVCSTGPEDANCVKSECEKRLAADGEDVFFRNEVEYCSAFLEFFKDEKVEFGVRVELFCFSDGRGGNDSSSHLCDFHEEDVVRLAFECASFCSKQFANDMKATKNKADRNAYPSIYYSHESHVHHGYNHQ